MHTFSSSPQEAEAGDLYEFQALLVYTESSWMCCGETLLVTPNYTIEGDVDQLVEFLPGMEEALGWIPAAHN